MPSTPPAAAAKRGHPSGPRASGSTGGAGRKRKRSSDRDSAAAAPGAQQRIDGVPPSLAPVLLHAIKSRRKYLSKLGVGQNQPSPTTEAAAAPTAATGTGDVLARVAARSEQEQKRHRAAEDANSPLERLASEDATAAVLQAIVIQTVRMAGNIVITSPPYGEFHRADSEYLVDPATYRADGRDMSGSGTEVAAILGTGDPT